jgi:hypothetical protein
VGVFRDGAGGVAGVIDEDFLGGDEKADGGLEAFELEVAVEIGEADEVE